MRLILPLHRYVGVIIGLVMALWCLSGFVMMYQGYPRLLEPDRARGLMPLRTLGVRAPALADEQAVSGFTIEMLDHRLLESAGVSAGVPSALKCPL